MTFGRRPRSPCAIAAAAIAIASSASAEGPNRHVVKAGDSCSSIAQKYYGDTRFVELLHAANPDLAKRPPPHFLQEGMVLVVPEKPAERTGPDAQLTTVKNQVEILTPEKKTGRPNDALFRGNRVSTEAASAADITFRDETQVRLGERTLVIILGDAKSAATRLVPKTETQLVTGNLRAFMPNATAEPPAGKKDVPRKATSASVTTDAAAMKVFDGEAQISSDEKKTARLSVYRGSSTIAASGTTREVARGFGSKAELGKPPTVPRALPSAPVWSAFPPLVLVYEDEPSITGEYAPAPTDADRPIAQWHVQVARDDAFTDVAVDAKVPATIKKLDVNPPGPGRWWIRVSTIDDDAFESPFSRAARTAVVSARETKLPDGRRRIDVAPADAFCVRVGNVPLARISGPFVAAATEPVALRCAPSPLDPTTLLSLDPASRRSEK